MDEYRTGQICNYKRDEGIGYIMCDNYKFLFTKNDCEEFNNLNDGDMVRFRAEQVNDVYRAFFVKKNSHILKMENEKPID